MFKLVITVFSLCLGVLVMPAICRADQNDPRLDELFQALQQTSDQGLLVEVENRIWSIWYEHQDPEIPKLIVTGTDFMNRQFAQEAMAIFSGIIQQYPDYAEAWNKRATLHYLLGNLQASIQDIDRTLALEPRHFGALSGLGLVYMQQQNLVKARDTFEKLLQVHPNSISGQQNLEMVNEAIRMSFI